METVWKVGDRPPLWDSSFKKQNVSSLLTRNFFFIVQSIRDREVVFSISADPV